MNCRLVIKIISIFLLNISVVQFTFSNSQNELQLKALFLYNFANFVEWPTTAFEKQTSPIELCLYGNVPFGKYLNAIDGTLIGQRELIVNQFDKITVIKNGCQMLFVGDDKQAELKKIWENKKHLYVLSVGENDNFINQGGIINIMRTNDSYTFDINLNTARKNGLFISSDLLVLARKIKSDN